MQSTTVSASAAVATITGHIRGGQQPITGAHLYLYAATVSGVGTAGYGLASTSLLTSAAGNQDASGNWYVVTGAGGGFALDSVSGNTTTYDYSCPSSSTQVYLYAVGGDAGTGSNSAAGLMAALGSCGNLSSNTDIVMNEVTTVAAAYALSGFATDALHISIPQYSTGALLDTLAQTGLTNAFANANQLADMTAGAAQTSTLYGVGIPNAAMVYTLANILAACVNSADTVSNNVPAHSANCQTLFTNSASGGGSTGTAPADTATAAINIAHHPFVSTAVMTNLYDLQSPTAPFTGLSQQPNDFTVSISYGTNTFVESPGIPAVDASGNVWLGSTTAFNRAYEVGQLSPLGLHMTASSIVNQPTQAVVDTTGAAWFAVRSGGTITRVAAFTGAYSNLLYHGTSNDDGHQIALVPTGGFLVNDFTNGVAYRVASNGTVSNLPAPNYGGLDVAVLNASTELIYGSNQDQIFGATSTFTGTAAVCGLTTQVCSGGGLFNPTSMAVDGNGSIWALNDNSTISEFVSGGNGNAGGFAPGSPFSGGGLDTTPSPFQPMPWLAIDGAGNIWVANYGEATLSEFSNSGTAISPNTGLYGSTASCNGQGLAIDGSGDIWVGCASDTGPVQEYIGAATPVVTPLNPIRVGVRP